MQEAHLRELLTQVSQGKTSINEAFEALRDLPFKDLDIARLDNHRSLRNGFPEVVLCEGKRLDHILTIMEKCCKSLGMRKVVIITNHPVGNWLIEKFHRTLEERPKD